MALLCFPTSHFFNLPLLNDLRPNVEFIVSAGIKSEAENKARQNANENRIILDNLE